MCAMLTRRTILMTGVAGGSLVLSGALFSRAAPLAGASSPGSASLTAWVRIDADNSVTLVASQSEMGQGITTTLAATLAEELRVAWESVRIEFAPFDTAYRDPVYQWMFTGNSQGISSFYDLMRKMGTAARMMLTQAAAQRLGVAVDTLVCEGSAVHHRQSGRSVTYGEVAKLAAKLDVPTTPALDPPAALPARRIARWDIPGKVDGSAVFGIDVQIPGMVAAAVRCAPRFGARLTSFDAAAIKSRPGVIAVVEVPNGLAVIAKTYWQARRALDGAKLSWSNDGSVLSNTTGLPEAYAARLSSGPFFTHKSVGDPQGTLAAQPNAQSATYELPFQAHATMEPMNCTAWVTESHCEIWGPIQGVELSQQVATQVTGLPSEKITLHRTLLGGGFGRRLLADFVKQALLVAMEMKRPVKLIWSREEDMTHDFYRPAMLHRISGAVDSSGAPLVLTHRVVSPSHMLYIFPRSGFPNVTDWTTPVAPPEQYDGMAVEGLMEVPYSVAHQLIEQHRLEIDVPVSVWRTTGHGPNNFVLESFIDELATAAKTDPLTFRRSMLAGNPRARRVLDLAAEKIQWGAPPASNRARGIALAVAFGGITASAVELTVAGSRVMIHRVVCAVDCGRVLDPGIAESNIIGGIVWGLSGMKTAITFDRGRAMQTNFTDFEPLHLWETPSVEVHFLDSGEKLGGTGELGPVPLHAAVCNAIFAATGLRIRSLPLSNVGLTLARGVST